VFLRVRDTALLGRLLRFKLDDSFRLSHRFLLLFLAPPYLSSYEWLIERVTTLPDASGSF